MSKFYDIDVDIKNAISALKNDGVIICPTDTIWGLSCDATNTKAVEKIFEIKKRPIEMSMIILVSNDAMIQQFVKDVPEIAWQLLEVADKPLTIIYPGAKNLPQNVISKDGSIAIRVCKDEFCNSLISRFRKPIISTSANFSGEKAPLTFGQISNEIIQLVDYVVEYNQLDDSMSIPSSIIKIGLRNEIKIIRQ